MTVIDQGLISFLQNTSAITNLVSTRSYLMMIPQNATLPCITVQRISTPRNLTHDSIGAIGDLAHPRFQFDAWAATYSSAKTITDAIRESLNGKQEIIGVFPNAYTIQAALVQDERMDLDSETQLYRSQSDYFIWHVE